MTIAQKKTGEIIKSRLSEKGLDRDYELCSEKIQQISEADVVIQ